MEDIIGVYSRKYDERGMPIRSIPKTEAYTGTVTWHRCSYIDFESNASYTAGILLVPKPC